MNEYPFNLSQTESLITISQLRISIILSQESYYPTATHLHSTPFPTINSRIIKQLGVEYFLRPENYNRTMLRKIESEAMSEYINIVSQKCNQERNLISSLKYKLRRTSGQRMKSSIQNAISQANMDNCIEMNRVRELLEAY